MEVVTTMLADTGAICSLVAAGLAHQVRDTYELTAEYAQQLAAGAAANLGGRALRVWHDHRAGGVFAEICFRRLVVKVPLRPSQRRAALEAQHGDGCVAARKNRNTGTTIQVYRPFTQSGDPGWMVVCREHGSCLLMDTRHQAERSMAVPEWCEDCQDVMEKKA